MEVPGLRVPKIQVSLYQLSLPIVNIPLEKKINEGKYVKSDCFITKMKCYIKN